MKSLEPWIETYTGKKFWFLNPQYDQIDIEDIAHSLANQCRFSGHTKVFYSVAQHSIEVSKNSGLHPLSGLLHDASEAYIHDIPSPVKPYLTNYHEIEETIMKAVAKRFGIVWPLPEVVKQADAVVLKSEAQGLLPSQGAEWVHKYPTQWEIPPVDIRDILDPADAKEAFLQRFTLLTRKETNCFSQTTSGTFISPVTPDFGTI